VKYARLVDEPWNARLALTSAPASEPVSVDEQKLHSRIDAPDDNQFLAVAIAASRQWIEQYLGRQLVTATWTMTLDEFPGDGVIELPRPPLVSVSSVKYYDGDRVLQTFDPASYYVHASGGGPEAPMGRIELAEGSAWPTTYDGEGAIEVAFVAGYGADAAVPAQIRQAIQIHAGELYERREQVIVGTISTPSAITVERLLWPLRVF
jgi:uncharacterized phiE125 gp8 family phage protein